MAGGPAVKYWKEDGQSSRLGSAEIRQGWCPVEMNIQRAKQEIKDTIEAYLDKDEYGAYRIPEIRQRPVLLMGPPGVGKTQIMEQIASECDIGLVAYTITHHTRQSAIGLPYIEKKTYGGNEVSVTQYTMSEIIASVYDRMEVSGKSEGILFIDEINCVSETLAPTMLQFLQCKTFGNQKVPKGWIIVAAGNPPEYNKSVRDFDVVTLDRVKVIDVEADYPVWRKYADQAGIHGAVISYLNIHRDNFYRCETTVDGMRFVTARGWEDLSEMLYAYERLGKTMDEDVVGQYLQYPSIAKDFANYLELYNRYQKDYQVDEILSGVIRPGTLSKLRYAAFDERVEIVSLLLSRLSADFKNWWETDRYVGHLYAILKEFQRRSLPSAADGTAPTDTASASQAHTTLADKASAFSADTAPSVSENEASCTSILESIVNDLKLQVHSRLDAGQSEKALTAEYRPVFQACDRYVLLLSERIPENSEAAFDLLRESFMKDRERLDAAAERTSARLEYAFDFMEAAFGEGQEMVYFITELSVNLYAMDFLKEHESPRYYRYNKSLLFDDAQTGIRRQLDDIRSEMRGE